MTNLREEFRVGDRRVLPALGRIEAPHLTLHLEPRVMELLVYMAGHAGRVVSRDAIIRDVWRGTQVTDDVITRSISQIRRALSEDWRAKPVIETIPKRGYRLLADVSFKSTAPRPGQIGAEPPTSIPPALMPDRPTPGRARIGWLVASCLAASVVGMLYFRASAERVDPHSDRAAKPISSVLIAPFTRADGPDQSDYLSAGLSSELVNALSSSAELRVIGSSTANALARSGKSPLQAAQQLQVGALITGTIKESDQHLTISVSMIDPGSGRLLHGHDYQFPIADALTASESIARDVEQMLGIRPQTPALVERRPRQSLEAFQLFLHARYYLTRNSAGAFEEGIDYLKQAVALDPDFARAHAALAIARILQVDFGNFPVASSAHDAQTEADIALALQPQLAEAHAAKGLIDFYLGHPQPAAVALRHATALCPNFAQAHLWLGRVAQSQGQVRRSIASYQLALDIEPLSPLILLNLGLALDMAGHYAAAEHELRQAIMLQPDFANLHWALGYALWHQGQVAAARRAYLRAIDLGADYSALYGELATLLVDQGTPEQAQQWIQRGERIDPENESVWLARLSVAAATRRFDEIRSAPPPDAHSTEANAAAARQVASAMLEFYRGESAAAMRHFDALDPRTPATLAFEHNLTLTLAGHAPALDVAAAHLLGGQPARGREMLQAFHDELSKLRSEGLDSPGLDYQEAAIAALSGDPESAQQWLRTARAHGWSEEWWIAADPKLAGVSAL